jgi:hypothetical protein
MAERGTTPWIGGGTRTMLSMEYLTYTLPKRCVKSAGVGASGWTVKAWQNVRQWRVEKSTLKRRPCLYAMLDPVLEHRGHQRSNGRVLEVSVAEAVE